jgi:molybdopterin-containing oxidoreductase family membrane subunit
MQDYWHRDMFKQILTPSYESYFLWAELGMAFVIPITMLSFKKVRLNPNLLYLAALSSLLGFVCNRMNVSVTGLETWTGHHFFPKWTEFSITLMICAMGFFLFSMAVKYLPIFEDGHHKPTIPVAQKAAVKDEELALSNAD